MLKNIFKLFKKKENVPSPKELVLQYRISAGIPFKWEYEIKDNKVVEFVKQYVSENDYNKKAICGGTLEINYVFKGLKKGKTNIIFKYVSIDDKKVHEEENNVVVVDDELNISLESKE